MLLPLLFVITVWWVGTGVVLYLQQRLDPRGRTLPLMLIGMLVLCAVSIWHTAASPSPGGIAVAFLGAVAIWGVLELSYYLGIVTGTHSRYCPANCDRWVRFKLALGTSLYHELSIVFIGIAMSVALWQADNPVALYTFAVLWLMRWSAKLNLFFGVPNFNSDWIPDRLAYLDSYMRRSRVSALYPVSMMLACLAFAALLYHALNAHDHLTLIYGLPAFLLMLAVVEHVFMALPVEDNALWNRIFNKPTGQAMKVHSPDVHLGNPTT